MPENNVTNSLCDARMENIDTKLSNINSTTGRLEDKIGVLTLICEQVANHDRRLSAIEKWKEAFSFTRIVITMSAVAVAITTIYNFVMKIIMR
jgi:hypothetical protein